MTSCWPRSETAPPPSRSVSSSRRSSAGAPRSKRSSAVLGIPYGVEARVRFAVTPLGHALISLLRFAWAGGGRRELYGYLRSPYSGISRTGVDFAEGRLRGRAIEQPVRVEEETERLRDAPLVALRELREADSPLEGVRTVLEAMVRAAYGLEAPPAGEQARLDLRGFAAAGTLLDELALLDAGLLRGEVIDALARLELSAPAAEPGRVAIVDLLRAADAHLRDRLRARARGGNAAAARAAARRSLTTTAAASSEHASNGPTR